MRIGIDIDGVLTNEDDYILDYTSKYCYENGLDFFTEPYRYEYQKLNWNKSTIDNYRSQYFMNYVDEEPPRKFASEVIKKLKNEGHSIYIITGRTKTTEDSEIGEIMRTKIKKWLEKNEIVYDKIMFAKMPKTKEIKENNIDRMIEDSPEIIPIISKNVHVLCYDTRYNRNLQCSNMTRVYSWYDILRKIVNSTM